MSCHEPAQLEIVGLVVVEEPGLNLGLHLRIVPTLPRSKTLKYNQIWGIIWQDFEDLAMWYSALGVMGWIQNLQRMWGKEKTWVKVGYWDNPAHIQIWQININKISVVVQKKIFFISDNKAFLPSSFLRSVGNKIPFSYPRQVFCCSHEKGCRDRSEVRSSRWQEIPFNWNIKVSK